MKVTCNGFNIYNQLNHPDPVVRTMTPTLEEKNIIKFYIRHSYSVVQISDKCLKLAPKQDVGEFEQKIVGISCNNERILVLDHLGTLYKLDIHDFSKVIQIPNFVISEDPTEKLLGISCGSKITVAYTDKGSIYNSSNKLNYENAHIIDIKCGNEHCLLLDETGNVYSFGIGSRGQVGHGTITDVTEPELIEALAGLKIVAIAAGYWHSCAVSKDGDLYVWGWNGNGQLGLGEEDKEGSVAVMASPKVVDFQDPETNVLMVACGARHTVVLLDDNKLFGAGWNKYKQLKEEDTEHYYTFTYLHNFADEEIIDIQCGPWNTAVLTK